MQQNTEVVNFSVLCIFDYLSLKFYGVHLAPVVALYPLAESQPAGSVLAQESPVVLLKPVDEVHPAGNKGALPVSEIVTSLSENS